MTIIKQQLRIVQLKTELEITNVKISFMKLWIRVADALIKFFGGR
ncbi:hypothetical protein [Paenibacillus sp. 1-18]|nr:hypothetical protein [Paenibacillus sp. 1-18]